MLLQIRCFSYVDRTQVRSIIRRLCRLLSFTGLWPQLGVWQEIRVRQGTKVSAGRIPISSVAASSQGSSKGFSSESNFMPLIQACLLDRMPLRMQL